MSSTKNYLLEIGTAMGLEFHEQTDAEFAESLEKVNRFISWREYGVPRVDENMNLTDLVAKFTEHQNATTKGA